MAFSQRRRCLHPPCRSPGRSSFLCCVFSLCADSLASAATSVGRNLITVFSTVNTPRENFSRSRRRPAPRFPPCIHPRSTTDIRDASPLLAHHANESAENKCLFHRRLDTARSHARRATRRGARARCVRRRSQRRKTIAEDKTDFAPHNPVCAKTAQTFRAPRQPSDTVAATVERHARVVRRKSNACKEGSPGSASGASPVAMDGARCAVHRQGDGCTASVAGRISVRLPRAARRSRQDRAGR